MDGKCARRSCFFPAGSERKRSRIIRGKHLPDDFFFFTGHSEGIFLIVRNMHGAHREPSGQGIYPADLHATSRHPLEEISDLIISIIYI